MTLPSPAPVPPTAPGRPRPLNGATVHGPHGIRRLRHRAEMPLLWASAVISAMAVAAWLALVIWLAAVPDPIGPAGEVRRLILENATSTGGQVLLAVPLLPLVVWGARALLYAKMRASSVQMSPTQFPEGYRMVVEAAEHVGLRRVPDAYVVLGNGRINAFAAGHGFRRFVAVYSDLFETGDPHAIPRRCASSSPTRSATSPPATPPSGESSSSRSCTPCRSSAMRCRGRRSTRRTTTATTSPPPARPAP